MYWPLAKFSSLSWAFLFSFSFFFKWNESKLFHLSPTFRVNFLIVCPYHFKPESFIDLLGTSILQLQIHDLAGGVNFLFPFKLLLVQNEIPFKLKGLDWSLKIKENRTERKHGFSLELYLKRVTSGSGLFFLSLPHPTPKGYVYSSFSCKNLNCINMCMYLQSFLVWFGLQYMITACKNHKCKVLFRK